MKIKNEAVWSLKQIFKLIFWVLVSGIILGNLITVIIYEI
jgi:hypothetical protein